MSHQNKQHRKINKPGTESSGRRCRGLGLQSGGRGVQSVPGGLFFLVLTGAVAGQKAIEMGQGAVGQGSF